MKAIIVDLDGTLVNNQHKIASLNSMRDLSAMDWDKWNENTLTDPPNDWCLDIVSSMGKQGYHVLFITNRSDSPRSKAVTEQWLNQWLPSDIQWSLYMRNHLDTITQAFEVKRQIYWTRIANMYEVSFALDDDYYNCQMWRGIGIPALHCSDY